MARAITLKGESLLLRKQQQAFLSKGSLASNASQCQCDLRGYLRGSRIFKS